MKNGISRIRDRPAIGRSPRSIIKYIVVNKLPEGETVRRLRMNKRKYNINKISQLHFDIVTGCQLSCVGCPTPVQNAGVHFIDPEDLYVCLNNLDVNKVNVFRLFNYGEPLLHPDLAGIGAAIKRITHIKFNAVEISTNAQRCNWDDFTALLKLGVITNVVVSCDGDATAETYEKLRPPAKWEKLLYFFERCSALVAEHSPETNLMTRTIINSASDVSKWEALLKPYGFTPECRGWKVLAGSANNMTGRDLVPGRGVCMFVEDPQGVYVNAHGDVVPCCAHPMAGKFGNLMAQRFSDILNGDKRKTFVNDLRSARESMPVCSQCEFGPESNPGKSAGFNLPEGHYEGKHKYLSLKTLPRPSAAYFYRRLRRLFLPFSP